jgi:hypothetical protein
MLIFFRKCGKLLRFLFDQCTSRLFSQVQSNKRLADYISIIKEQTGDENMDNGCPGCLDMDRWCRGSPTHVLAWDGRTCVRAGGCWGGGSLVLSENVALPSRKLKLNSGRESRAIG